MLETALLEEDKLDEAPFENMSVAKNVLGIVERSQQNEWFNEICQQVLEKKNALCCVKLLVRVWNGKDRSRLFQVKMRRLEEGEYKELEQPYHLHETQKFYQKPNTSRRDFVPRAEMCRD